MEGAFDLFQVESVIRKDKRLHDFGVVALMGTFFGEKRKDLITGIFDKVMVMLDNDESGREAAKKITKELSSEIPTYNITEQYPEGKDPGICTEKEIRKAILRGEVQNTNRGSYLEYLERLIHE